MSCTGRLLFLSGVLCGALTGIGQAEDAFERHTLERLQALPETAKPVDGLSMEQGMKLKPLDPRGDGPCLVVRTDEGNWAKAVVTWGYRKGAEGGALIPVVLIERYVTYRGDRTGSTTATGRDVMLFAGFRFNFDIGQVVPDGQGGNVGLSSEGLLQPLDKATLYALDGPLVPPPEAGSEPNPHDHDGVLPRDFAGTWDVDVDGRWKGEWQLAVDGQGKIAGRYLAADSQGTYEITGRMAALPHRARLSIRFDNMTQTIDAFLWTKDKSSMTGSATVAERDFGFLATRRKPTAK